MKSDLDRWFATQILPHEAALIRYTQDIGSLNVMVDELTPDRRLSAGQDLQRLAEAFGRLSEMAREVIWLRRVEGLSQREAAQRLGIHEGALEGYMCRGLQMMADVVTP